MFNIYCPYIRFFLPKYLGVNGDLWLGFRWTWPKKNSCTERKIWNIIFYLYWQCLAGFFSRIRIRIFFLSDPDPDSGKKVRSVQKDPDPKHCLSTQYAVPPYTHIHSKLCIYVRVIYTCAIHYNMHITLIDWYPVYMYSGVVYSYAYLPIGRWASDTWIFNSLFGSIAIV